MIEDKTMRVVLLCITIFFFPAAVAQDQPVSEFDRSCVGVIRVLELFAEKREDTAAMEKLTKAKNRKLKDENLKDLEAVSIVMAEMQRATQLREVVGLTPEQLEARYKTIYSKHCR